MAHRASASRQGAQRDANRSSVRFERADILFTYVNISIFAATRDYVIFSNNDVIFSNNDCIILVLR